jgi:hypothetical protein
MSEPTALEKKTRWIYGVGGQPAYYQNGDYIYSKNGKCEFSVSDRWWFPIKGGAGTHYVSEDWVYSQDGNPAFYFG